MPLMLQSPRGRARLLAKFPGCKDAYMKYATLVPAGQQNASAIAKVLANKGLRSFAMSYLRIPNLTIGRYHLITH